MGYFADEEKGGDEKIEERLQEEARERSPPKQSEGLGSASPSPVAPAEESGREENQKQKQDDREQRQHYS